MSTCPKVGEYVDGCVCVCMCACVCVSVGMHVLRCVSVCVRMCVCWCVCVRVNMLFKNSECSVGEVM